MFKKVLLTFFCCVLLVGCQSNDDAPADTGVDDIPTAEVIEPTTAPTSSAAVDDEPITIKLGLNDWERGDYDDLIDAFHEEHPDIRVKVVSIDELRGDPSESQSDWET